MSKEEEVMISENDTAAAAGAQRIAITDPVSAALNMESIAFKTEGKIFLRKESTRMTRRSGSERCVIVLNLSKSSVF